MKATIAQLDRFLRSSDADSMAWADGERAEEAEGILAAIAEQDWPELKALCSSRGAAWRACLASILRPRHGKFAEHLMLELAWDSGPEVAFFAVSRIAFYCGVNDSAKGPLVDLKIRDASFLSLAKATAGLVGQVRRVSASCHPHFQKRIELLAGVLESEA